VPVRLVVSISISISISTSAEVTGGIQAGRPDAAPHFVTLFRFRIQSGTLFNASFQSSWTQAAQEPRPWNRNRNDEKCGHCGRQRSATERNESKSK